MSEPRQAENAPRSRFPDGFRIMQGKQEYVTYVEHASIRIWHDETPGRYEAHCHSAVEIIIPLKGEVIYQLPGQVYHVQSDEVLIVPPNVIHSLAMYEGSARQLLLFEPDSIFSMRDIQPIDPLLHAPIYLSHQPDLQESVRPLLMQCVNCYERKAPMWNAMCYAYLLQVYARLGQHYAASGSAVDEANTHRMDPEIVDSARLYIDQHFRGAISLEDVSSFTGFSKYYFSRVFKNYMGISFSEYLRQKRVGMAEELLIHSKQSIQEIAIASGFGSVATFNRVFRDARSCTPSRYREIYGDFI